MTAWLHPARRPLRLGRYAMAAFLATAVVIGIIRTGLDRLAWVQAIAAQSVAEGRE